MRLSPIPIAALLLLAASCQREPQAQKSLDAQNNGLADASTNRALASAIQVNPRRLGVPQPNGNPLYNSVILQDCLRGLIPGRAWAEKLPVDLPLYPAARLDEAAGHDGDCIARVASFHVVGDRAAIASWYTGRAKSGGYDMERADEDADWVLAGIKGKGFFYIVISPTSDRGRTSVDYIWTQAS